MELVITCPEIPIALRERDMNAGIHHAEQGFNHQKNHVRITNLKSFVKLLIMHAKRQSIDVGFRIHEKQEETRNSDWGNHRCFNFVHRNMYNIY